MQTTKSFHLFACINKKTDLTKKSCGGQSSEELFLYIKDEFKKQNITNVKLTKSLCLGKCSRGPAFILYPVGEYLSISSKKDADLLIGYLTEKNDIQELML